MISRRSDSVWHSAVDLSFNINDLIIPDTKEELLVNAKVEVDEVGITTIRV